MLGSLAEAFPIVKETFDQASEVLAFDLWRLAQEGPEAELNITYRTQPALLAAGVAVWRAWCAQGGPTPAFMAGHSLGEYTALTCSGAVDFPAAVRLVEARGRYMQEAVPTGSGAMAAILGLDDARVEEVCRAASGDGGVTPANYNSPGQVVIAGDTRAVQRAVVLAKEEGAKRAVALAVSVPSHCALMRPAAQRLADDLAGLSIRVPAPPLVHNVDALSYADPDDIRDALVRQLYSPVRWSDCVRSMAQRGVATLVEAGPGKVLTGLVKRIDKGLVGLPVFDPTGLDKALAACT
jgi:[acyl-carrier-protein] S-malonyltransferase